MAQTRGPDDAGERLKEILPRGKIIVLSVNEDYDAAAEALHPQDSYHQKNQQPQNLTKAVRAVSKGNSASTARGPAICLLKDARLRKWLTSWTY
jgi:DNA-binding NarL/FixJ family response regulator